VEQIKDILTLYVIIWIIYNWTGYRCQGC